jgi:hypothetical protein
VLYNRLCLFLAKRLRDYQRSRLNAVSYIGSLVGLLILTICAFALINYATFKTSPSYYQFSYGHQSFFSFIYYAAGSMFYTSNGILPVEPVSQFIQLLQFLFGVLLLGIFATILITTKNEKSTYELEDVIQTAEREGRSMEHILKDAFNEDSVDAAIEALQTAKAGLIGVILWATKNLGETP